MFEFSFGESITKEFILSKVSEEEIFCYYLEINSISKKLIRNRLRKDNNPTCGFYRNSKGEARKNAKAFLGIEMQYKHLTESV